MGLLRWIMDRIIPEDEAWEEYDFWYDEDEKDALTDMTADLMMMVAWEDSRLCGVELQLPCPDMGCQLLVNGPGCPLSEHVNQFTAAAIWPAGAVSSQLVAMD